jgi:LacI family transcriptional regulator
MVAFLIPDITNPYYPVQARGLQDALVENAYHTFLCNTDAQLEQEREFVADAIQRRVDGIVMVSFQLKAEGVLPAIEAGIPFISLGVGIDHPKVDMVATDDRNGAMDAVDYLIRQGHQRIGMIGGTPGMPPSEARLTGYREALEKAKIPFDPQIVVRGDFTRKGGTQAMRELMARTDKPTAVFCANDLMAIGAMDVARERHLAIPGDVAVVGYDDIEAASLVTPALTTVLNPAYDMGKAAGQLLLERMIGKYRGERRKVIVPHQIVERESA